MATEAELIEQKREERKKLLEEIKRKKAAAAYGEGVVGAAERGEYGDVGQGGEKGEFDDEINQDPGNEDPSRFSMANLKRAILGEGGGLESLMYFLPGTGDVMSAQDSIRAAKAAQEAENIVDKIKLYGLSGLAAAGALPVVSAIYDAGGPAVKRMIDQAIKQAENMGPQPALAGGVMNIDDTINMDILKMSGAESPPVVGPGKKIREVGVGSGNYSREFARGPKVRELEISSQRQYVNKKLKEIYDSAPKNKDGIPILSNDWFRSKKVKQEIYDSNPDLFPEWKDGIGSWDDLTDRFLAGKIIQGKKTGVDEVTLANRELFPVSKTKGAFERAQKDFNKEVAKKLGVDSLSPQDPTFKYLNFIRLTEDTKNLYNPNEFFKKYKFEDLNTPGTKLNENFEKFKVLENKRIELRDDPAVQALIKKIIPDENVTFQIAHTFEGGQIRKKRVSKSKQGEGGNPDEMYIDLSTINVSKKKGMQKELESKARDLEKLYTETGDIEILREIKKISERMDALGVQGQTVTQVGDLQSGFILGSKDVNFSTKLETLANDRGIKLTDDDRLIMLKIDNTINSPKEIMQGTVELKNRGGMVGISHLTRPLGNF
jgi:hypothetical protein